MADYNHRYMKVEHEKNGVLLIQYNKPETGNSMHPVLVAEFVKILTWAETLPQVHVIVLTGTGRFFSTGMELVQPDDSSASTLNVDFHQLVKLLILSEKILIAAVNGPASGFGVSGLALFDLVYSVPDAYFFTPFVKWGMTAEAGSSITFPRIMGHQKAALLCLAGDRITAQHAEQLGLISKILPSHDFLQAVLTVAEAIAASPPGSLRTTKRLMRDPVRKDLLDANDREMTAFREDRIPSGEPAKAIKQFAIEQKAKQRRKSKL